MFDSKRHRTPHVFKGSPHTQRPTAKQLEESGSETWSLTLSDESQITAYDYGTGYAAMRYYNRWTTADMDLGTVRYPDMSSPEFWEAIQTLFDNLDNNQEDREMHHRIVFLSNDSIDDFPGNADYMAHDPSDDYNALIDLRKDIITTIKLMDDLRPMRCYLEHQVLKHTYREIGADLGLSHTMARNLAKKAESLLKSVQRSGIHI
jgi:hypothetical protein